MAKDIVSLIDAGMKSKDSGIVTEGLNELWGYPGDDVTKPAMAVLLNRLIEVSPGAALQFTHDKLDLIKKFSDSVPNPYEDTMKAAFVKALKIEKPQAEQQAEYLYTAQKYASCNTALVDVAVDELGKVCISNQFSQTPNKRIAEIDATFKETSFNGTNIPPITSELKKGIPRLLKSVVSLLKGRKPKVLTTENKGKLKTLLGNVDVPLDLTRAPSTILDMRNNLDTLFRAINPGNQEDVAGP